MDAAGRPSAAQIVVLATSSALTAVFYAVYKNRATTVARLKVSSAACVRCGFTSCHVVLVNLTSVFQQEAKKVSIDHDLKTLLSETPGRCVPYAVIEGKSVFVFLVKF